MTGTGQERITKAIVVRQPWATLIALGVKTIETRPAPPNGPMRPDGVRGLPGLAVERGERIAIVAGAAVESGFFTIANCHHLGGPITSKEWRLPNGHHLPAVDGVSFARGAVVCTAVAADALPVLGRDDELGVAWLHHIAPSHAHGLALWRTAKAENLDTYWSVSPIHDQLPLGNFTPGRWGWMLTDVQPVTKACPRGCADGITDDWRSCGCQNGRVPSDPIPCKGQQGVFRLPADVAQAIT